MSIDVKPVVRKLSCTLVGHLWIAEPQRPDRLYAQQHTCLRCGQNKVELDTWEHRVPRHLAV